MERRTKLIAIVLAGTILSGCTTWTKIHRGLDGQIEKVESSGSVKTIVKEGDLHIEQDAKNEPLIKLPDVKVGNIQ